MERVEGLRHDLGKYLVLPLAMLPAPAGPEALRAALDEALHRTRRGPDGVRDAGTIWRQFQSELGPVLSCSPGYERLQRAVDQALDWRRALTDSAIPLEQARILRELRAVGQAIDALLHELEDAAQGAPGGGA